MSTPWLITALGSVEYSADRAACWLSAETYNGNRLVFWGSAEQNINIRNLTTQSLPIAVISDNCSLNQYGAMQIPRKAMLAVIPISSVGLQQLIDQGKADQWLATLSSEWAPVG